MGPSDLIDLRGIAKLLRISPHTPNQWRQRSRAGLMKPPLPDPLPDLEHPTWRKQDIINWAIDTNRWPPSTVARTTARPPAPATPAAPVKKAPTKTAKKPAKTAAKPTTTAAKVAKTTAKVTKTASKKQTQSAKKASTRAPEPSPTTEQPKTTRRSTPPPVVFQSPPEERGKRT